MDENSIAEWSVPIIHNGEPVDFLRKLVLRLSLLWSCHQLQNINWNWCLLLNIADGNNEVEIVSGGTDLEVEIGELEILPIAI